MKYSDYDFIRDAAYTRRVELNKRKRRDYADSEDVLSNFKRLAQTYRRLKVDAGTPEGVALFFVLHKVDRLAKLIGEGATPQNESLRDNLDDAHVYLDLLEAILTEKEGNLS